MASTPLLRSCLILATLALGLPPQLARAADESPAAAAPLDRARALGRQALTALDAADFALAERLFTEALQLYEAPTLRLGRARAAVGLQHWLAAREDYRAVITAAPGAGDTQAFAEARRAAETELAALNPRIPKLEILTPGAEGVSIQVDGQAWAARPGESLPLDPGVHQVTGAFPSGIVTRRVALKEGLSQRFELWAQAPSAAVAPTAAAPSAGAPAAGAATAPAAAPSPVATKPAAAPSEPTSNGATWVAGIGTGALVVGAVVTGIVTMVKRGEYDRRNQPDVDYATKRDLRSDVNTWAWVNTVLTGGAVVGAGITTVLWVSQPASVSESAALADGFVLGVSGRF
jgi:hypothetical protein